VLPIGAFGKIKDQLIEATRRIAAVQKKLVDLETIIP